MLGSLSFAAVLLFANQAFNKKSLDDKVTQLTFEQQVLPGPQAHTPSTATSALADMNNDTYLDLLVARPDGVHLYLNDTTGNFMHAQKIAEGYDDFPHLTVGDIDEDGDYDFIVTGPNGTRIYKNTTH